jgi:predicted amidohydrolase YtcJ
MNHQSNRPMKYRRQIIVGLLFVAAALLFGASLVRGGKSEPADLLLLNGRIYTSSPARHWMKALAIRGERVLAAGSAREIETYRGQRTQVIDLGGRMAMPGIIDSHLHFLSGSLALDEVKLDDARTLPEVKRRIRDYAAAHPERPWVLGRGWYYDVFKPALLPTRQILDEVVPDRPAALSCFDGHSIWVNSRALALAGIDRNTPDPEQGGTVVGIIVHDPASGEPSGVLKEAAIALVRRLIPEPTRTEKLQALRRGLEEASRHGLTSVVNASGSLEELELYDELRRRGELSVRTYTALMMEPELTEKTLQTYEEARRRFHDEWVRAGAIKAFMDGVVESHTAAMLAPYADDPQLQGSLNYTPEQFRKNVLELDRRHFHIMTHAIGDRAIRTVLDAYQAAQRANGRRDRRFRIEHIEIIDPEDIPRFGRLGVIASMQPYHAYPGIDTVETWAGRIGPARLPYAFPWHDLAATGARLAFGSDWPVVSLDPFIGIQNAVTREDVNGQPPDGWVGRQKVTLPQALAAYTRDGAYAEFQENLTGTLEPGKLADVIVLSQDLFAVEPLNIGKTNVLLTLVGGKIVHRQGL